VRCPGFEKNMDRIGASNTWETITPNSGQDQRPDGRVGQRRRWGGGLWINTGTWRASVICFLWRNSVLADSWSLGGSDGDHADHDWPDYGYLWWLNTQGKQWPDTLRTSYAALGRLKHDLIDPEHDLVVVWRWH
jgi:hypothetical protein